MRRLLLVATIWFTACALAEGSHCIITGKVYGPSCVAIKDAKVILVRGFPGLQGAVLATAKSGQEGEFRISYFEPPSIIWASLYLVVRTTDLVGLEIVNNPKATQRVTLHKSTFLSGVVSDDHGRAIEGAIVKPVRLVRSMFLGEEQADFSVIENVLSIRNSVTDRSGNFRLEGLPGGWAVVLSIQAKGYEPFLSDSLSTGQTNVVIKLKPSKAECGQIRGCVLDRNTNKPIPEVTIGVVEERGDGGTPAFAVTGPDGCFEVENVFPGKYAIVAVDSDRPIVSETIEVFPGETAIVTLYGVDGVVVKGRVLEKGSNRGLGGLLVGSPGIRPVETDAMGNFSVRMAPGPSVIMVYDTSGTYASLQQEIEVPDDGISRLLIRMVRSTRIKGRVVAPDGKPCDGAVIRVLYAERPGETFYADSKGIFIATLDDRLLSSEEWVRLIAYCPHSSLGTTKVVQSLRQKEVRVELKAEPTGEINGCVRSEDGTPIPDAKVTVLIDAGNYQIRSLHNIAKTNETGKYTLSGLITGLSCRLRVDAIGYSPLLLDKLPEDGANLILKRP